MKKVLATILALVMALGLTTMAWADGVAKIGSTGYATLAEAITAASDGDTIVLQQDVTLTNALKIEKTGVAFTIDLGKKTLTGRVNIMSGTVTITNGKVVGDQPLNVYGSATSAANFSVLNIENDVVVNEKGDDKNSAVIFDCLNGAGKNSKVGYGAVINISGTVYGTVFVSGNLGNDDHYTDEMRDSNIINVKNGAVIYTTADQGIAMNGAAVVNIENGASVTGREAVGVKRGALNVNGGTLTAVGNKVEPVQGNTNGTEKSGAAISVTNTYNGHGNITVNVNGGTITSTNNDAIYKGVTTGENFTTAPTFGVTGGTFSSDVSNYVAGDTPVASFNDDTYYVGAGTIQNVANNLSAGQQLWIVKGNVTLMGVPAGVTVYPEYGTVVYVNGKDISNERDGYTVPQSSGYYYYQPTTDTKTTDTKGSPKTFDAGIALYVGMALTSAAGVAFVGKKRED
ncbi:MAG: hypothetical protein MR907_00790 [Firmicutes bacterium]|nr:hypothetical protein [Bacillota bacterium]